MTLPTSEQQMSGAQPPELTRDVLNSMPSFQTWRVFSWIGFYWEPGGFWKDENYGNLAKKEAVIACNALLLKDAKLKCLVTRYPCDPDAMYFDIRNMSGLPARWTEADKPSAVPDAAGWFQPSDLPRASAYYETWRLTPAKSRVIAASYYDATSKLWFDSDDPICRKEVTVLAWRHAPSYARPDWV